MLVHTKGKQFASMQIIPHSIIHAFEPSPNLFAEIEKTYQKGRILDATTLPLDKPMNRHFSRDLTLTYVVKLSKPK